MKKILLVDDEHSFLQILDMALSKYFETYTATGVREAIDILKQNTIGLICSDLYMRDGTGVDLLKEVKKSHKNKILQENTPYAIAEPIRIILAGIIYVDGMQYRQLTIIVTTPNFPAHLK